MNKNSQRLHTANDTMVVHELESACMKHNLKLSECGLVFIILAELLRTPEDNISPNFVCDNAHIISLYKKLHCNKCTVENLLNKLKATNIFTVIIDNDGNDVFSLKHVNDYRSEKSRISEIKRQNANVRWHQANNSLPITQFSEDYKITPELSQHDKIALLNFAKNELHNTALSKKFSHRIKENSYCDKRLPTKFSDLLDDKNFRSQLFADKKGDLWSIEFWKNYINNVVAKDGYITGENPATKTKQFDVHYIIASKVGIYSIMYHKKF